MLCMNAYGMKRKENPVADDHAGKIATLSYWDMLPAELHDHILSFVPTELIQNAGSLKEVFEKLTDIKTVSPEFYALITTKAFIKAIVNRYISYHPRGLITEFLSACSTGNVFLIKAFLLGGFDLNFEVTPLERIEQLMNRTGFILMIGKLSFFINELTSAAITLTLGNNALMVALSYGHMNIVKVLLFHCSDNKVAAFLNIILATAVRDDEFDIAKRAISVGADINAVMPLGLYANAIVWDTTILSRAIANRDSIQKIKQIIELGADVNVNAQEIDYYLRGFSGRQKDDVRAYACEVAELLEKARAQK